MAAQEDNVDLAAIARACQAGFHDLVDAVSSSDYGLQDLLSQRDVQELRERYEQFAGNLGALQPSQSKLSLEHRLRDASVVREAICRALIDLQASIQDAVEIASGLRENRTADRLSLDNDADLAEYDVSSSSSESDASSRRSTASSPRGLHASTSEIQELALAINVGLTSLFKTSIFIRKFAPKEKRLRAAEATETFDNRADIMYINDRYPSLATKHQALTDRLGEANARRRQYFKYRRDHHKRLSTPRETSQPQPAPTTPVPRIAPTGSHASGMTKSLATPSKINPTLFADSEATKFLAEQAGNIGVLQGSDPEEPTMSVVSYATSIADNSDGELEFPELPAEGHNRTPFLCPYCFTMQQVKDNHQWRRHVLRDIEPYICTFPACGLDTFESQHSWFDHELLEHRHQWVCVLCTTSSVSFASPSDLRNHVNQQHLDTVKEQQLPALLEQCKRPVTHISPLECPFCEDTWAFSDESTRFSDEQVVVDVDQFRRHVSRHLQQIALFSLPRLNQQSGGSIDSQHGGRNPDQDDLSEGVRWVREDCGLGWSIVARRRETFLALGYFRTAYDRLHATSFVQNRAALLRYFDRAEVPFEELSIVAPSHVRTFAQLKDWVNEIPTYVETYFDSDRVSQVQENHLRSLPASVISSLAGMVIPPNELDIISSKLVIGSLPPGITWGHLFDLTDDAEFHLDAFILNNTARSKREPLMVREVDERELLAESTWFELMQSHGLMLSNDSPEFTRLLHLSDWWVMTMLTATFPSDLLARRENELHVFFQDFNISKRWKAKANAQMEEVINGVAMFRESTFVEIQDLTRVHINLLLWGETTRSLLESNEVRPNTQIYLFESFDQEKYSEFTQDLPHLFPSIHFDKDSATDASEALQSIIEIFVASPLKPSLSLGLIEKLKEVFGPQARMSPSDARIDLEKLTRGKSWNDPIVVTHYSCSRTTDLDWYSRPTILEICLKVIPDFIMVSPRITSQRAQDHSKERSLSTFSFPPLRLHQLAMSRGNHKDQSKIVDAILRVGLVSRSSTALPLRAAFRHLTRQLRRPFDETNLRDLHYEFTRFTQRTFTFDANRATRSYIDALLESSRRVSFQLIYVPELSSEELEADWQEESLKIAHFFTPHDRSEPITHHRCCFMIHHHPSEKPYRAVLSAASEHGIEFSERSSRVFVNRLLKQRRSDLGMPPLQLKYDDSLWKLVIQKLPVLMVLAHFQHRYEFHKVGGELDRSFAEMAALIQEPGLHDPATRHRVVKLLEKYSGVNRLTDAEDLLVLCLDANQKISGPQHHDTQMFVTLLRGILEQQFTKATQGSIVEELPHYRKLQSLKEGLESPPALISKMMRLDQLSQFERMLNDDGDAANHAVEAFEMAKSFYGANSPEARSHLEKIDGIFYRGLGPNKFLEERASATVDMIRKREWHFLGPLERRLEKQDRHVLGAAALMLRPGTEDNKLDPELLEEATRRVHNLWTLAGSDDLSTVLLITARAIIQRSTHSERSESVEVPDSMATDLMAGPSNQELSSMKRLVPDSHTTNLLNPDGNEYLPHLHDFAGEKKIDSNGNVLDGRQYLISPQTLLGNGTKQFLNASDCAALFGYKTEDQMFEDCPSLFRVCDKLNAGFVSAASMFRRFGHLIIKDGKDIIDDYWEDRAKESSDDNVEPEVREDEG